MSFGGGLTLELEIAVECAGGGGRDGPWRQTKPGNTMMIGISRHSRASSRSVRTAITFGIGASHSLMVARRRSRGT